MNKIKARIKSTGEIKELFSTTQDGFKGYVDRQLHWYYPKDLDFSLSESESEHELRLEGWMTADEYEWVNFYETKPTSCFDGNFKKVWRSKKGARLSLGIVTILGLTLENSPMDAVITINLKENE